MAYNQNSRITMTVSELSLQLNDAIPILLAAVFSALGLFLKNRSRELIFSSNGRLDVRKV